MQVSPPDTPIYDLGRPMKAHDVRRLRPCALCGGIGFLPQMLTLALDDAVDAPCHGSCVVRTRSHEDILALPREQRSRLRLNETGPELMRKLLDHRAAERGHDASLTGGDRP